MSRRRKPNTEDYSDRKHLTGREIERLIEATRGSRNKARDRCLLLLMFRLLLHYHLKVLRYQNLRMLLRWFLLQ